LKSGVVFFTPTKVQLLDDGISALTGVEDTPHREKRRKKACDLMDGIHDILSPSSTGMSPDRRVSSVVYHREVSKAPTLLAHGLSPLIPKLARAAMDCMHKVRSPFAGIPPRIIDITHIEGEYNRKGKAVGCHFAPVGSSLYGSLKDIVPNTATGVFYAKVPNGYGGWKGSTFFPGYIADLKVLLDLILTGKEMTRCGTRTLYKVESDKIPAPFYLVAFNWASASVEVENSCFPVYDFIEVNGADAAEQGLIDDAEQMLVDLISVGYVVQQASPLQFVLPADGTNPERLVFDFGPSTGARTKVFQGVFVVIPTAKFSKLAGPDLDGILAQVR
jgi:hypothetical protein